LGKILTEQEYVSALEGCNKVIEQSKANAISNFIGVNARMLNPNFDEWRKKGLNVDYVNPRKMAPRIIVFSPHGAFQPKEQAPPAVQMGAGRSMEVAVPPGAVAGALIHVQTPTGETVEVQVPPSIPEGGVFMVQY